MNIYLDVDGVLLDKGVPSKHVSEFLKQILYMFPANTYWLTTRCNGNSQDVLDKIQDKFEIEIQELLKMIKPTSWPIVKTQAIDFSKPFLWYDDQLGWADHQLLIDNDAVKRFRRINLEFNQNQLANEIEYLRRS